MKHRLSHSYNRLDNFLVNFLIIENKDFIRSAMKILSREEKRFVISRYYRGMTQKEIALKNGVSQMYISRLERKVLEKIKKLYLE